MRLRGSALKNSKCLVNKIDSEKIKNRKTTTAMTSAIEKISKILVMGILITEFGKCSKCQAQQTNIALEQGSLTGLKVFPDSSRTAVYAFLGIPYAQPPVGVLRFAHPKPHLGWNGTWQAMTMKPICPQLANTIYDETTEGSLAPPARMDEDCLYLNIWIPESGMRYGNLPVLVIITGEEMSYDWPRNRATGLDLAAEGVVVVSIQYRSNIFGWISTATRDLDGNYGLRDQELALQWIQRNIKSFGGDRNQVTLLGHGTSAAACALVHALTWHENDAIFSKLILMSGGQMDYALNSKQVVEEASRVLIQKLGCHFEERGNHALCLRTKSVSDLLKAFETIYDHGNGTLTLGPVVNEKWQEYVSNKTRNGDFPPTIIGITTNEGAFLQDYWLDLAREGYDSLRTYVNYTVLPAIIRKFAKGSATRQFVDALNWRYFSGEAANSVPPLLHAIQKLLSESYYERSYFNMLQILTNDVQPGRGEMIFAYIFDVPTSMDMRGRINLFGGTSHSADLPFLLGPSLFQQISRRRFTAEEDKLCRKIRTTFVNFIKSGNPTPGRIYDAWLPFTQERNFIYKLGEGTTGGQSVPNTPAYQQNLPQIEKLLQRERPGTTPLSRLHRHDYGNPYQLSPAPSGLDQRRMMATVYGSGYATNQQDSGYGQHLQRLHGFWQLIIPTMRNADGSYVDAYSEHMRLMEAAADAARYRQGFYAMLGLVCALLAILCLCVYLLRRDPFSTATTTTSKSFNL